MLPVDHLVYGSSPRGNECRRCLNGNSCLRTRLAAIVWIGENQKAPAEANDPHHRHLAPVRVVRAVGAESMAEPWGIRGEESHWPGDGSACGRPLGYHRRDDRAQTPDESESHRRLFVG